MQTACAYTQTGSIYTDPRAEVTKASKPAAVSAASSGSALDLTSHRSPHQRASPAVTAHPHPPPPPPSSTPSKPPPQQQQQQLPSGGGGAGLLNLKKESSLLKPGAPGVSGSASSATTTTTSSMTSQAAAAASLLAGMDLAALAKLDPITAAALQVSVTYYKIDCIMLLFPIIFPKNLST